MNARQKAKYYKRKYEQLKSMYVPLPEVRYKVDSLHVQKMYRKELININDNRFMDLVRDDLMKVFITKLNDYVEIAMQEEPFINLIKFDAKIKVVNPKSGYC